MDDDVQAPGTLEEKRFAALMRTVRESKGISQEDMGRKMVEAGWAGWRQTTVSRIEAGNRTVRLAEAHAIARILGLGLTRMLDAQAQEGTAEDAARLKELESEIRGVHEQIEKLQARADQLTTTRDRLAASMSRDVLVDHPNGIIIAQQDLATDLATAIIAEQEQVKDDGIIINHEAR